ncbi:hypothetical protein IE81DRAFT_142747 [Ceraceosorus guamensis]|uniref:Uncharacterized protein n=1 Tax=Ceraceosorus guamensis TaxID=1522189 RepID=A0A316W3G7_9BASI|nr:hypothetical protein IE81DRAFT_142747 [Ceraceosorus guamensis]PWN42115.1 hypothetical protein IE81DRAFT_142747 [Ceraceosorus guamensis]
MAFCFLMSGLGCSPQRTVDEGPPRQMAEIGDIQPNLLHVRCPCNASTADYARHVSTVVPAHSVRLNRSDVKARRIWEPLPHSRADRAVEGLLRPRSMMIRHMHMHDLPDRIGIADLKSFQWYWIGWRRLRGYAWSSTGRSSSPPTRA